LLGVLSIGEVLLPIIGGVIVGLLNVLQPLCIGEGTSFLKYLFTGVNGRHMSAGTLVGAGFLKVIATRAALGFGFVGGKFFPSMFLGGCIGCAIFLWCNEDDVSIIEAVDMPLLFPFACLFIATAAALGPIFFSMTTVLVLLFGLHAEQASCVFIASVSGFFCLHGIGPGLLPLIGVKKLQKALKEKGADGARGGTKDATGQTPATAVA